MNSSIAHDRENAANYSEADDVAPEREDVEAETAQNRRAGDFDVQAILLVDQGEVADFVDDQAFEAVVEDGELGRLC